MKISIKQYAAALCESVECKSAAEIKLIIKKFVELLAEKKFLAKSNGIISEFGKIWNEKYGIVESEIVSANKLDKDSVKLIELRVVSDSGAEKVIMKEKIDKNILGGAIIRYGDKIFDASMKTVLSDLKEKLVK